ncbi:MAG TPA: Hsp20/alpha crystallin family protein [Thermodesulfobacteriaceae bacterium]|nr:Hsp20/alpha crystallin family protein [Thermodesulfobacteriaceae bacterium]
MFEISPWKPIRELTSLRKEMDNLWENFFGGTELMPFEGEWVPSIDVSETDDSITVKAEIPGIDPKDIQISLSGNLLTIKGEKKEETEEKKKNYLRKETRYGAFSRTIRLPVVADADKIEAKYKKGILNIVLPKKEEEKPKQIEIKAE